jgi:N-acetylmuramoyl-L-alanine amidase
LRSDALPGLLLGLTSTACLLACVATASRSGPPARTPTRTTASTAASFDPASTISALRRATRTSRPTYSTSDLRCLARAMWHEAQGEPMEGKIAVAEVVIARTGDRRFPSTVCGVIRAANQFSFVHGGIIPIVPADHADEMTALARKVASGLAKSRAVKSLWFHATYSKPAWRHDLRQIARIGGHVFYGENAKA